jgi:hypothetical protein
MQLDVYLVIHPEAYDHGSMADLMVIDELEGWSDAEREQLVRRAGARWGAAISRESQRARSHGVIYYGYADAGRGEIIPGSGIDQWGFDLADPEEVADIALHFTRQLAGKHRGSVMLAGTVRDDCVRRSASRLRSAGWQVYMHEEAIMPLPPALFNDMCEPGERLIELPETGIQLDGREADWQAMEAMINAFGYAFFDSPHDQVDAACQSALHACAPAAASRFAVALSHIQPRDLECWGEMLREWIERPREHGASSRRGRIHAEPGTFIAARFACPHLGPALQVLSEAAGVSVRQLSEAIA